MVDSFRGGCSDADDLAAVLVGASIPSQVMASALTSQVIATVCGAGYRLR
jgi:hypothetical protein